MLYGCTVWLSGCHPCYIHVQSGCLATIHAIWMYSLAIWLPSMRPLSLQVEAIEAKEQEEPGPTEDEGPIKEGDKVHVARVQVHTCLFGSAKLFGDKGMRDGEHVV